MSGASAGRRTEGQGGLWPVRRPTRGVVGGVRRALAWAGTLFVVVFFALVGRIYLEGRRDEAAPADAIVVLGTAQYNGVPSPVLRARLDHALALYRQGVAPLIITTGGHGRDPRFSEGGVGRAYLEARGVPAEALLAEEAGESSWQSLKNVAELAAPQGVRRVVVVSDPFHMARLKLMARDLGFEVLGSPTRTSPISRSPLQELFYVLREAAGILVYWARKAALGGGA